MIKDQILMTGATGVFGRYIARHLLLSGTAITFLVRADSDKVASDRLSSTFETAIPKHCRVLAGDVTQPYFGLNKQTYASLTQSVTAILHAAGSTRFNLPLSEARAANVVPAKHIIDFARESSHIEKVGYVSTAFLVGKQTGKIPESSLASEPGFINTYDQTKYIAENMFRNAGLPFVIYRPSLVVGDRTDGFNAALIILGLAAKGLLPILPGSASDKLDVIPAEFAGQCIASLFTSHFLNGKTFHIALGGNAPTIGEILSIAKSPRPIHYSGHIPANYDQTIELLLQKHPDMAPVYQRIDPFIRYLLFPKIFDTSRLNNLVGKATIPSTATILPYLERVFANA